MAFILVSHLEPTHISLLPQLLQKHTKMKVIQAEDGLKVQSDHVYVIPPNRNIGILNRTIQLMEYSEPRGSRMPIDYFLQTLAEDQEEYAICIILSGTGSDGSVGLRAIKEKSGLVMVQDESSAKYDGMPKNAVATGLADSVLPVEKMPEELVKYTKHILLGLKNLNFYTPEKDEIPDALQKIYIILRSVTSHDFSSYRQNTLRRRIQKRMSLHQLNLISDYVRYLNENTREADLLFKELLIGVTSFFRDPEGFDALKTEALYPLLKKKGYNQPFRVWVTGCSTGEEAYSLAILIQEYMEEHKQILNVQIFATDIDEEAIRKARTGFYPAGISEDVSEERLKRFFVQEENGYRIKKEIRGMLIFAPHNLIKDAPFTRLDMLCCRNLLIYLNSELQKKLIPIFHYSLLTDGLLFLGSSENIGNSTDLFSPVNVKWKIYKRRGIEYSANRMLEFPDSYLISNPLLSHDSELTDKKSDNSRMAEYILKQTKSPPCVMINKEYQILFIHGKTGKYLELAQGKADLNILKMVHQGLKKPIASAVSKAVAENKEVIHEGLRIRSNGDYTVVNLIVKPVFEPAELWGLILITFEEIIPAGEISDKSLKDTDAEKRLADMEFQLISTKEDLQLIIEELETSNEELRSTNEELQSTNEELQSTNEELETSKEELQSLHEETETVNVELEKKIEELMCLNNDMENLLYSPDIAVIFLNMNLCIRRFTPKATELVELIENDIGRPLKHFAFHLKYDRLFEDAEDVITTLKTVKKEAEDERGRWFSVQILPYRTTDNKIDGVVITFQEITVQKRLEKELKTALAELEKYRQT